MQLNTSTNHKEYTPESRRLNNKNIELLKKLNMYGADPSDTGNARDIATGKELTKKVKKNLIKAQMFGDEMYSSFCK